MKSGFLAACSARSSRWPRTRRSAPRSRRRTRRWPARRGGIRRLRGSAHPPWAQGSAAASPGLALTGRVELVPEDQRQVALQGDVADPCRAACRSASECSCDRSNSSVRGWSGRSTVASCRTAKVLPAPGGPKTAIESGRRTAVAGGPLLDVLLHDVAHAAQALDLDAIHRGPAADGLHRDAGRQARGPPTAVSTATSMSAELAVRLREDGGAGGRAIDDAGELVGVARERVGDGREREGLGSHVTAEVDDEAVDVRGPGAGQAALDGVDQRRLAFVCQAQGHRRVDAASVGGADAGKALAPVALLRARVEDEHVGAVALHDERAHGADDDDHAPRHDMGSAATAARISSVSCSHESA